MSKQHTKMATHEKMVREYGDEHEHKHNKDHLEFQMKDSEEHLHLHGGHNTHKPSHHHHKTAHTELHKRNHNKT
ncbi:hypothetical protein [Vibrio sp. 10N.261.51.F12]|uniref:hypothetical protein n=1 Tax=Vibrio sp. 10N.261.51.F12 TaxID=3229679 RepID=UPI00354BD6E8